jgi:hypothetical protein
MRGVPDATGDQEDFWDDRFYQMVFGIYLIWCLDVMSKTARIGKPLLFWLTVGRKGQPIIGALSTCRATETDGE